MEVSGAAMLLNFIPIIGVVLGVVVLVVLAIIVGLYFASKNSNKNTSSKNKNVFSLASIFSFGVSDDLYIELKRKLIEADAGLDFTNKVVAKLKEKVTEDKIKETFHVKEALRTILLSTFVENKFDVSGKTVLFVAGVNGVGKTTTIAKLANMYKDDRKVLLAAADTFRAAAIEQLENWANRLDVEIVKGQQGGDPGAVLYDAMQKAKSKDVDILITDTAGRFHNKEALIRQLEKMRNIVTEKFDGYRFLPILVLDSTVGGNGIEQAKVFTEHIGIEGVVLAKFDASAKGGVAFAINEELSIPVVFIGVGEKPENIERFNAEAFVSAVLGD